MQRELSSLKDHGTIIKVTKSQSVEPYRNKTGLTLILALSIHNMIPNIPISPNLRRRLLQARQASRDRLLRHRHTIFLPLRTTVDTSDPSAFLALLPLLEAVLVKVLTAGRLAPDDVLIGLHVEDADGAFAVNGLAVAGVVITVGGGVMVVVVFAFGSACNGRVCEY